ncbi:hypothetical protein AB85_2417 [Escherichia coli 2-156-04_S3_C1]|nr:hypothetical protein AB85_2417 [Escherichia coli 2-156-04_S3_C1]KEM75763.1 hypothetical protein AC64_5215 [Escherichia coli 6-537-08_S3_C3]
MRNTDRGGTTIIDPENTLLITVKRQGFAVLLKIFTVAIM